MFRDESSTITRKYGGFPKTNNDIVQSIASETKETTKREKKCRKSVDANSACYLMSRQHSDRNVSDSTINALMRLTLRKGQPNHANVYSVPGIPNYVHEVLHHGELQS